MKKMSLLILVDIFYASVGGAERQIMELSKNIDKNRFGITVACLSTKDKLLGDLEKCGIDVLRCGVGRIYDWQGIRQGFKFRRILKDKKIDILMTYHFGSDIWGTFFGKLANVPVIISNRRDAGFWRNKKHVLVYKWINRWVKKFFVVSQAVKAVVIKEEGVPSEKIEVIYNGIDLSRFSNSIDAMAKRQELGFSQNDQLVCCVGNLKPVKGHEFLVEAAGKVITQYPKTHFLFFGWDEEKLQNGLQERAKQLGIENHVHFLGARRDIPELLPTMDICVLPSLSEGMSNAIQEYMAAGKPVIATNVGGNPELIEHGFNGLLVEKADAAALAAALAELLRDAQKREHLGKNGYQRITEQFSLKSMVQGYENALAVFSSSSVLTGDRPV